MRRGVCAVLAAGLTASAAMASNINISVQGPNGEPSINVAANGTANYRVVGTLTDDLNEGLALIGLSLRYTGGPIGQQANSPADQPINSCANPMRNFVIPEGITNPAGYGCTLIGGELIQCCGAQNTIKNTIDNADFPIGDVLLGVARPGGCGQAILLTGSFNVGAAQGNFQLQAFDVFGNGIKDGELTTDVFLETEALGLGTVTPLNITVGDGGTCEVTQWQSVGTHAQGVGDVALDVANNNNFSEARNGVKKLVVSFNGAVDPTTVVPGNVIRCGNNSAGSAIDLSGVTVTTAATNGNTKMEITFTPALPDFGRYRIALSGVECVSGAAAGAGTGGLSRILTALQGDANGDRRVNATDVGAARSLVPRTPINPAVLNEVRSDANNDGRINATDVGGIRGKVPNNATAIPDPVCP